MVLPLEHMFTFTFILILYYHLFRPVKAKLKSHLKRNVCIKRRMDKQTGAFIQWSTILNINKMETRSVNPLSTQNQLNHGDNLDRLICKHKLNITWAISCKCLYFYLNSET